VAAPGGNGPQPAASGPQARPGRAWRPPDRRFLGWVAGSGIGTAIVIMVMVSVAGPSRAVVRLPRVGAGPPWWVPLHLPALLVTVALWVAAVAGVVGVGPAAGGGGAGGDRGAAGGRVD